MWQVKTETEDFEKREGHAVVGFKDYVFLFGGKTVDDEFDSVYKLNQDFTWQRESYSMSTTRSMFTALANGKLTNKNFQY